MIFDDAEQMSYLQPDSSGFFTAFDGRRIILSALQLTVHAVKCIHRQRLQ